LSLAGLLTSALVLATGDPAQTVAGLHQGLLGIMQGGAQLGFAGRRSRIAPVVDESFDFDTIARVAMGRYWQQMTAAQQERSRRLLRQLTIDSYADNFADYGGETFRFVSSQEGRRGRKIVRTELLRVDETPVQLDYVLKRVDGRWRIINVVANGVSDLSLKHAEYGSILRKQGIASLLQQIAAQIKRLYPES